MPVSTSSTVVPLAALAVRAGPALPMPAAAARESTRGADVYRRTAASSDALTLHTSTSVTIPAASRRR